MYLINGASLPSLPQVMSQREEMSEKIQELEEELTMALSELKKYKESNKHFKEV